MGRGSLISKHVRGIPGPMECSPLRALIFCMRKVFLMLVHTCITSTLGRANRNLNEQLLLLLQLSNNRDNSMKTASVDRNTKRLNTKDNIDCLAVPNVTLYKYQW